MSKARVAERLIILKFKTKYYFYGKPLVKEELNNGALKTTS
jgi:hypothetical protein